MREPRAATVSRLFPGARLSYRRPSLPLASVLGLLRRRLVFSLPLALILGGEEKVEKGTLRDGAIRELGGRGAGRRRGFPLQWLAGRARLQRRRPAPTLNCPRAWPAPWPQG